jgi:hypothetical protein
MRRILARTLLDYSTDYLWTSLVGRFILVFDDGEMEVDWISTCYSSYAWEFHREFRNTPMLMKHHVTKILGSKRYNSGTHLEILGNCMWSTYDKYQNDSGPTSRDALSKRVYQLFNLMYNDLRNRARPMQMSLDILNFIEILDHPEILKIKMAMNDTQKSIEWATNTVMKTVASAELFPDNPISKGMRSSIVKSSQVQQCIGPRGNLTELDSITFRHPIKRGYAEGFRKLCDSMMESRSAGKASIFAKSPLQKAEYFSRRLQLMDQVVQNLHHCDCGSTTYTHFHIRPRQVDDETGEVLVKGDLPNIVGAFYMSDEGVLEEVMSTDTHLIGTTIKMRSVHHCQHPDPYGVCSVCFGRLSDDVPEGTNLGHMCTVTMCEPQSQSVISVKHLDGNAVVKQIKITDDHMSRYLKVSPDGYSYLLSDNLKGRDVTLVVIPKFATGLTDIFASGRPEDHSITRVSEMPVIGFLVKEKDCETFVEFEVAVEKRMASMSYALLNHAIKDGKREIDEMGNYNISMKGWDWSKEILTLPLKHANMSDYSNEIAQLLESSVENLYERDKVISPDAFLTEFFDLVNSKLDVNLKVLEVIMYGCMIRSADEEDEDYRLPKVGTDSGLGVMRATMEKRSAAPLMAFEHHHKAFTSPESYLNPKRANHPMDGLIMPFEVFSKRR